MSEPTPFDRPPYDVIAVFDPDGEKPSFAYTTGVFEAYGLPELFVWAVPDVGVDAGERWQLSTSDQHTQLSDAVDRLRAGVAADAGWEHCLDGERTVLRTTLVPADDDLPTYALSSGTPVRRLHLELIRPPVGTPSRLPAAARKALVRRKHSWADVLVGGNGTVRTGLAQRYGPCTAGVQLLLELLQGLRAIWLMAWTGRERALMAAADLAEAPELLEDDRVWELLAAALVLDVAPDAVTLLPPQHRAA